MPRATMAGDDMATVIMSCAVGLALAVGLAYLAWGASVSHTVRVSDRRARRAREAFQGRARIGWPHEDVRPGEAPMTGAYPGQGYINREED